MGSSTCNDRYVVSFGCCRLFDSILVTEEKGEDFRPYSNQFVSTSVGDFICSFDIRKLNEEKN